MRFLTITFLASLFFINQLLAQAPFAQVNQLPLLMSPSMAGAKNAKRLCLGFNRQDLTQSNESNYALSYDQMLKKTGIGIGVYGLYRSVNTDKVTDQQNELIAATKDQQYLYMSNHFMAGFAIAPQYNVYSKKEAYKIKFTCSPSFFAEFASNKISVIDRLKGQRFYTSIFSPENPSGMFTYDHFTSDFLNSNISSTSMKAGMGLKINTEKLLVLYKAGYVYEHARETITHYKYTSGINSTETASAMLDYKLYNVEQSVHVGYSISRSVESRFSITPIIGLGSKHYLNLASKNIDINDTLVYSKGLLSHKVNDFNYLHGSLNIKFSKLLLGFACTKYYESLYKGLSAGYQNRNIKLVCNATINKASKMNVELTSVICF